MKKLMVLFCLFCATVLYAQDKVGYAEAESITFFGVDYSFTRLYGVGEEPHQYKMLFRELNNLVKSEPKKFDLKKIFGKNEVFADFTAVNKANSDIDATTLKIFNKEYKVSPEQVKEYVQSFDTGTTTGYGALLVCTLLDRTKNRGSYYIIIFDAETKEIIKNKYVDAKATGNNYQDYWSSTISNALKQANK